MAIISKIKRRISLLLSSSQFRFALSYICITTAVLCLLNYTTAESTRNLIFQSKKASLQSQVQSLATSLSSVPTLSESHVTQVASLFSLDESSRILIVNQDGTILYDSHATASALGKYALLPEIYMVLQSQDVFTSQYDAGLLTSSTAVPILYQNNLVGAVYLSESDSAQGAIIGGLESTIFNTTVVLGIAVSLFSIYFSASYSRRMRLVLHSIRKVGEGAYSHKIAMKGRDEVGVLATEFNKLTQQLQESQESQRRFVSDASHELKTPLASIKLLSDSILQNPMDESTMREFVGDIGNEADRLTRLAQKLLALTRGDQGAVGDFVMVEGGYVIEKAIRLLKPTAQLKNITLKTMIDANCPVVSREDDLHQIVFNLVENAIKYNRENGVVTIGLQCDNEDITLTISDTGTGIPENSIDHIFERFYRVDKARSRQAGGNGLGLSIVSDLVKRNLGSISVSSQEDVGTCFTIKFPFFGNGEALL